MDRSQRSIPQASLSRVKSEFEDHMIRVTKLINSRAIACYMSSKTDSEDFVQCYKEFYNREQEILPLVEQRLNWSVFRYGQCLNDPRREEKACLAETLNNMKVSFDYTLDRLKRA